MINYKKKYMNNTLNQTLLSFNNHRASFTLSNPYMYRSRNPTTICMCGHRSNTDTRQKADQKIVGNQEIVMKTETQGVSTVMPAN